MSNLEQLFLDIPMHRSFSHQSFIDGNNLKNEMINHMPKLSQFVFSIHSNIDHDDNLAHIPSNDDVQRTFQDQTISYIHYFPKQKISQCHIYSYPYQMNSFHRLTNSFPGGLFPSVHKLSLFDEYPFEHEFFIRISQSFPYLRTLIIHNESPQNHKQHRSSLVKYPYLAILSVYCAHEDYVEEFLDEHRTCLSNDVKLSVSYGMLRKVTNNFTRASTRINCKKISFLYDIHKDNVPDHFYLYFPHVKKS